MEGHPAREQRLLIRGVDGITEECELLRRKCAKGSHCSCHPTKDRGPQGKHYQSRVLCAVCPTLEEPGGRGDWGLC